MRTVARAVLFNAEGDPLNPELHQAAVEFCARELADKIDLKAYRNVWAVCREDKDGKLVEITGIGCGMFRYEIAVLRFLDSKSGHALTTRFNEMLCDGGVPKDTEILVFADANEAAERRCKAADEWISSWKAEPSRRLMVRVR